MKGQIEKRVRRDIEWGKIIEVGIRKQEARAYDEKNTKFQVKRLMSIAY